MNRKIQKYVEENRSWIEKTINSSDSPKILQIMAQIVLEEALGEEKADRRDSYDTTIKKRIKTNEYQKTPS